MGVLPFYLVFELISAVVEVLGVVAFMAGLALRIINLPLACSSSRRRWIRGVLTIVSVITEELTYHISGPDLVTVPAGILLPWHMARHPRRIRR